MKTKTTAKSKDKVSASYFSWLLQQEKELDRYWGGIFVRRKRLFISILETKIGSEEKNKFILAEIKEAQKNLSDETLTSLYLDLNLPYEDLIESVTTYRKTITEFAAAIQDEKIPGTEFLQETPCQWLVIYYQYAYAHEFKFIESSVI